MREKKDEKQLLTLPVYESHPPKWLPKIHGDADLGYPGFHPPRPGQDEDTLSEGNIKHGFILGQPVSVETFSAQAMINEKLHSAETLPKLEQLMNEVFIRRAERIPPIPPSTFRMPTRVTLNDAKRQAWFADLANPGVPLHKLGKSVPHGAKGHDLLDLLQSNNVAISRAVWFLRVFGANETAGLRNKPSYVPTQYSIDWANVVTGYMKKQISEIALPSAPRPGLNIKQTFKGVLADADTRERWISRFTYCLKLLRTFYTEDLVDHRTFLTWLTQQMITCNLAQAGFLARLAEEYLDDIMASRALARPLVEGCLAKLMEIHTTPAHEFLHGTGELLKVLLQHLCLALPDAFVSPRMWTTYSMLLDNIMSENPVNISNDRCIEHNLRDIRHILSENHSDIKKRNEALLFCGPIPKVSARLGTAVSDVKLLNSISSDTDMAAVGYFSHDMDECGAFKEKLDLLLTWSVTPLQYGDHRPFAAATLIRTWRDKACDRASRRNVATPSELLQDQLFDWLDTSDVAGEASNIRDIALLYGKLVKHEVFSYSSYIQRLVARGEAGLSYTEDVGSRHRLFLSWIPLSNSTLSLINQRKVTLYGARTRETPEDITEREMRKEIRIILPDLFEGTPQCTLPSTTTLLAQCKTLISATRFEQVRTFRQWLLPVFRKHIIKAKVDHVVLFKSYLVTLELMAYSKCFHSALDLTLCVLEHSNDAESMNGLIGTFYRYATIWTCMDVVPIIVQALDRAHQVWKLRGVPSRPLLALLIKFDNGRYLNEGSRERIVSDSAAFTLALQPIMQRSDPVPEVLPEILLLAGDPDPKAPSILVDGLWLKYRTSSDWAWKVWDNTVASLRQIPSMTQDIEARRACALRYSCFLWRIGQHLPHGLDGDVLQWFLGPGKSEVVALSGDAWDVLSVVLLHLVVNDALKTTTIMEGLVYPAWQLGAAGTSGQVHVPETYLHAANNLCFRLLLQDDGGNDTMPPIDLSEVQSIRTRRQAVYDEPHFPLLVASIPTLISLENNQDVPEALRNESTSLRCRLCQGSGFRQGAYRNLDVIREAFESSPYLLDSCPSSESSSKRAVSGLKMILCDSRDDANIYDWPEVTCLLSPWKIAATTIQMQLQLKQLGRALSLESTCEAAGVSLDRLTSMLFHHTKTSEEASYVGEMARGADSIVASRFINNGFRCMTELLSDTQDEAGGSRRVGEMLRVLVHVSQPIRGPTATLPSVEAEIQEAFIETLDKRLKILDSQIANEDTSVHSPQDVILPCRLLQFILSFRVSWTPKTKDSCSNLSVMIFRLALHCAGQDNLDINAYPVLIDTLLVLIDEMPYDSKLISFDPFRHYPNLALTDLPPELPFEYRNQISTLLVQCPPDSVVTNLVNTHRDAQGNEVSGSCVTNRPWEWIENLGEPSVFDAKEDEREKEHLNSKYLVKNSGSISLDHFGARLTGDGIKHDMITEIESRTASSIRSFEDGCSENLFNRDWREMRLEWDTESSPEALFRLRGELDYNASVLSDSLNTAQSYRKSPPSSVVSRGSTQGTGSSSVRQQQSPSHTVHSKATNSTVHEIIDVDSVPTTSSLRKESMKRKTIATHSDDEIEIVEGPVANRVAASSKRQKIVKLPAGKTKARKK